MIRFFALAFTVSTFLTSLAYAQTAEQLMLLQANPGLAQQLQNQLGAQAGGGVTSDAGVPTSGETQVLNADDAVADPSLLTQSTAPTTQDESVIQRYYRILAGETLPIYGAAEFAQSQDTQLLFFNTMGKDYRLAAGDVLRVTLRGLTESDASYKIGRDGNLILPALAPFSVAGLTITEAESKLLDVLRYDDASATVYMSLETARLITVQVSGAVKTPRTLAVPAYTPLSRVLAYAGGIKPTGSLRNIILRDRDGNVNQVDFYDFLQSPIGANDPLVTDSSRVFVGNQGSTVAAIGFVARPGVYELPEGVTNIRVRELLDLTGTTILPPGMEIEALYFDAGGITSKRSLDLNGEISAGEVLDLRFVETQLQRSISVVGAVLDEYEMASREPVVLADLLKNGSTLSRDAFLDFALIVEKTGQSRALSLRNALADRSYMVPVDSVLVVFNTKEFRRAVQADPNSSDDPLVAALTQTELSELYLNGDKIALLPPVQDKSFGEILRPFYRLTPAINLDLAIIENSDGAANSVSLRALLQSKADFTISPGDKIHLFESQFLINEASKLGVEAGAQGSETWRKLSDLFARARVRKLLIDNDVRALLPRNEALSIASILDTLGFDNVDRFSDLIVLERQSDNMRLVTELTSASGDISQPLPQDITSVSLYSPEGKTTLLRSQDSVRFDQVKRRGVSLFVDYAFVNIGISKDFLEPESELTDQITAPELYPLFAIYEYFNVEQGFWTRDAISLSDLKSKQFLDKVKAGARITVFTRAFIDDLLNSGSGSGSGSGSDASQRLIGLQATGLDTTVEEGQIDDQQRALEQFLANADQTVNQSTSEVRLAPNLQFILSASRFVSGAVERPGYYPVAGSTTLSQILSAAGGLTENADIARVEVIMQKVNGGKIIADEIKRINLAKSEANAVRLTDRYSINVPALINEVATGLVTLSGEVQRPGEYLIARDETLHDLIKRAGGLTGVAYPLGAVFTRESLKESQKESNALLANQLEQAVLQVAQSNVEGSSEQVQAVLGYAQQLRLQDVTGRLSVNVALADTSAPVYLQAGDTLTIPKRPAHVSVIGSVQKDTVASYSAGKRLNAYLAAAGGANRIADLKRTYILLPNGESTSADEESIIPPGAVIVVPPKTDRLTVLGLTDLVSRVLGNIATSVLAINNVR